MAAPEFRLEQVLKFRKEVERNQQLELAAAREEHDEACALLTREETALQELAQQFMERQQRGIDAHELLLYSDFSARKRIEIQNLRALVFDLEQKVQDKLEALMAAAKDKKALEIFKEKQMRILKQQRQHKERDFMDEISIQKGGQSR
ncbi:flagellar export protein FliJ [Geomonas sp. RF6]|uniref:flagellar export protein FliJ n=1 Tax=Geomonas sp. RF6 TaxID=2897342 RepID=UPI001E564AA1|nr:flagellar export protein FliJ [Geomonas sp. RF6]UFS72330.1 flagellar export protein FliJ [Geomonas sp. RF6]